MCVLKRKKLLPNDIALLPTNQETPDEAGLSAATTTGTEADIEEQIHSIPSGRQGRVISAALQRRHAAYGNIRPLGARVINEPASQSDWLF